MPLFFTRLSTSLSLPLPSLLRSSSLFSLSPVSPSSLSTPTPLALVAVEVMDQQRVLHSGCLVSGVHTPPIRRNSKLASLGRIFKPWKWRKKKNEKLKQSSTGVRERECVSE